MAQPAPQPFAVDHPPLLEVLARAGAELSDVLMPPRARARVVRLLRILPAALSRDLWLELHLNRERGRTDIILGVEQAGREILAGENPIIPSPADAPVSPAWSRVRALARDCGEARRAQTVRRLWLEFDLPSRAPGVLLELGDPASEPSASPSWGVVWRAVTTLLGAEPDAATAALLERCVRRLPPGARIPYLGAFLPRPGSALRCCVVGVEDALLPPYLAQLGWPGDAGQLSHELRRLHRARREADLPGPALIHLDLAPAGVGPRLGLEFNFSHPDQVWGRLREERFLRLLVRRGLCTAEQAAALRAWPGCARVQLPHLPGPSILFRRVAHVKLVVGGGGIEDAKAYVRVVHALLSDRRGIGQRL